MGYGFSYKCTDCGENGDIEFDVGELYPIACEETKNEAASGNMGREWKEVIEKNPEGVFDCSLTVFECTCGCWINEYMLDYYISKNQEDKIKPYALVNHELDNAVILVKKGEHKCPKCQKNMREISYKKINELKCPRCGGKLDFSQGMRLWD